MITEDIIIAFFCAVDEFCKEFQGYLSLRPLTGISFVDSTMVLVFNNLRRNANRGFCDWPTTARER